MAKSLLYLFFRLASSSRNDWLEYSFTVVRYTLKYQADAWQGKGVRKHPGIIPYSTTVQQHLDGVRPPEESPPRPGLILTRPVGATQPLNSTKVDPKEIIYQRKLARQQKGSQRSRVTKRKIAKWKRKQKNSQEPCSEQEKRRSLRICGPPRREIKVHRD